MVEIARLLVRDARILILDEPTATLSDAEIERMMSALRGLRAKGRSILYVTHRLGEVFEICDSVTVLRREGRRDALSCRHQSTEIDRAQAGTALRRCIQRRRRRRRPPNLSSSATLTLPAR